jgi:hypothetical protein
MPCQQDAQLSEQEGRISLTLSAFQSHKFKSLQSAAQVFNVPRTTLSARHQGRLYIDDRRNAQHKLTRTKEQTIVQYILNLGLQGFAPRLCEVADMANKLLGVQGGEPVGKHWAEPLVTHSDKLKMAFNQAKDCQRILQENPEIISKWFKLVEETKAKYCVHNNNVHTFDKTGFQMGVIGTMKVVTGAERRT